MRYIFVPVSAVVLFFPVFWLFQLAVGVDWGAGLAAFFTYIFYPVMILRFIDQRYPGRADDISQALLDGDLEISNFSIFDAVLIEEIEDEGPIFLMGIDQNRTLCLRGDYLHKISENYTFPSTNIFVLWNRDSGLSYGIKSTGSKLAVERLLKTEKVSDALAEFNMEDRSVIGEELSSFTRRLSLGA